MSPELSAPLRTLEQAKIDMLRDAGRRALTLLINYVPATDKRGDTAIAMLERALSFAESDRSGGEK